MDAATEAGSSDAEEVDKNNAPDIDELGFAMLTLHLDEKKQQDEQEEEPAKLRVYQRRHRTGAAFTPLSPKAKTEVEDAMMYSERKTVLVFHEGSNIEVTGAVLQCLQPYSWLNDEVINVYMALLKERELRDPEKFFKCHFFNTFFYNKLFKDAQSYDYQGVRRWTARKRLGYSLLECDKILVPIHQNVHWCLAVIDMKRKQLLYLDSLQGRDPNVLKCLARYIVDEARERAGQTLDVSKWEHVHVDNIPRQMNGCDCGMFMLKYADFHSRGGSLNFKQNSLGDSPVEGNIAENQEYKHLVELATVRVTFGIEEGPLHSKVRFLGGAPSIEV